MYKIRSIKIFDLYSEREREKKKGEVAIQTVQSIWQLRAVEYWHNDNNVCQLENMTSSY